MIKETDKVKYDRDDQQYYITPGCVINELPINSSEMSVTFGDTDKKQEIELRTLCRRVYNYMYAHNNPENSEWIKYRIFLNQRNERYFLKEAMKSFVYAAFESGMDLNEYIGSSQRSFPLEVDRNLRSAQLIGIGPTSTDIPEGDY